MSTLAKRATPLQARIMRIVEGAVKNAIHAHPNLPAKALASSIAKRAAGTLAAVAAEALAAGVPSDRGGETKTYLAIPRAGETQDFSPALYADALAQAHVEGRVRRAVIPADWLKQPERA